MNRLLLIGLLAFVSAGAHAQAEVSACDSPDEAKRLSLSLESDMATHREAQRKKEVELENAITAETKALVADKIWTEDQRIAFFKNMMTDKEFIASEDAKKAYFTTFMTHAASFEASLGKEDYKQSCQSSLRMREQLQGVSDTNIKQYNYMLEAARAARSAKP